MLRFFANLFPWMLLLVMGVMFGLTVSLIKILLEAGYPPFGLVFFEYWFATLLLFVIALAMRQPIIAPILKHIRPMLFVALVGGLTPALMIYFAADHVQAGIIAIVIALIPMAAYGIAIGVRMEAFSGLRLAGVALGLVAILLITLPENSLPDRAAVPWILVVIASMLLVALNNVIIAFPFATDLGPVRLALGSAAIGTIALVPFAVASGEFVLPAWPPGRYDFILVGLTLIVAVAEIGFVYAVQRYGPVFANQTGYLVTIAGVLWGIALFGETHSLWIWTAFALVMAGVALVTPKEGGESEKGN